MDDFEQADRDDWMLELAEDRELMRADWADLHGETRDFISFYEACADQGADRADASRGQP